MLVFAIEILEIRSMLIFDTNTLLGVDQLCLPCKEHLDVSYNNEVMLRWQYYLRKQIEK